MTQDVLIVGAGVIGAACAYECAKAGLKVTVIEKRTCGSGASGSSAAMLELQIDAYRAEPFFSLAHKSRQMFSSLHTELKELGDLDIQYEETGIYQLALNPTDASYLELEVKRQTKMGLKAVWISPDDLQYRLPILNPIHYGAAFFMEDGQVNGERMTSALIDAAQKKGATIIENTSDVRLNVKDGKAIGVDTPEKSFTAGMIVVSAGAWTDELLKPLDMALGIAPVRGQLLVYDTPQRFLSAPIYTRTSGYITPKSTGFTLVGTTVEHVGFDESTTEKARLDLQKTAINLLPNFSRKTIRGISAGLRPGSVDGLPLIGRLDEIENLFIAAGHYRNGILLAPITAQIIKDLIIGNTPTLDISPFKPNRHKKQTLFSSELTSSRYLH